MKFKVTQDTYVRAKPVKAGTILDLNPDDPADAQTLGMLHHAGRLEGTEETEKPKAK